MVGSFDSQRVDVGGCYGAGEFRCGDRRADGGVVSLSSLLLYIFENSDSNMQLGCFTSSVGCFYRQETLHFEFHLMFGSEEVFTQDYDIEVCVRTSQLSRRLWVCDYGAGVVREPFRIHSTSGAVILRRRKGFVLRMTPDFLRLLCRGELTFGIRCAGHNFDVAETVVTKELRDIRY